MDRLPVAVLISGQGSNLGALLEMASEFDFPARIALVLSDQRTAEGLKIAARAGVPTAVIERESYADRSAFDEALARRIDAAGAGLVCLAGFMRILGPVFVEHYRDRLLNVHPSLLPAFPGLRVHERVLESGTRISGCTVHFVRTEMDSGPIVLQAAVPVHADDTVETLAARVRKAEHGAYPQSVLWFAEGRLRVEGQRVLVRGAGSPVALLANPDPRVTDTGSAAAA